jgi:hypothetical protein
MGVQRPAVHRTILVVDVEGFTGRHRTNRHQLAIRAGLYGALRAAFDDIGLDLDDCHHEDRGDGVLILVPPGIPKAPFTEVVPFALVKALNAHNDDQPEQAARIRIRMALHAGEIEMDSHGVTSNSLNHTFRLLEAAPLKTALRHSAGVLAVIISEWFYEEVTRHSPVTDPATFRKFRLVVREAVAPAWICLPDDPRGPEILAGIREPRIPPGTPSIDHGSAREIRPDAGGRAITERLDVLAGRIAGLGQAQRELLYRQARVAGSERFEDYATKLRVRLSGLRRGLTENDPQWTDMDLDECEHAVVRHTRRVEQEAQRLDRILAVRRESRGTLAAYRAAAADSGLTENLELADLYEHAHDLLYRRPFDAEVAKRAVDDYQAAVRRAVERGGRQ